MITGANTGIGFETAASLAEHGAHVVLAVRDIGKGQDAADRIASRYPSTDIRVQRVDLASLASISEAAHKLRQAYPQIDLLINNAGVAYNLKACTVDGFELQFGVNHLGHFALTGLLLDHLLSVAGSRVVTLSSVMHRIGGGIRFDDIHWDRDYQRFGAYNHSKLANLMFTYALQRRLASAASTIAVAAHPGAVDSDLARHGPQWLRVFAGTVGPLVGQSPATGAASTLRAATDPHVRGGEFYGPRGLCEMRGHPAVVSSNAASCDEDAQERLWDISEKLTSVKYPV